MHPPKVCILVSSCSHFSLLFLFSSFFPIIIIIIIFFLVYMFPST